MTEPCGVPLSVAEGVRGRMLPVRIVEGQSVPSEGT